MVDCNIHMKGCPMSEIERDVVEKMKAGSIVELVSVFLETCDPG
jgi:hypothetical protein